MNASIQSHRFAIARHTGRDERIGATKVSALKIIARPENRGCAFFVLVDISVWTGGDGGTFRRVAARIDRNEAERILHAALQPTDRCQLHLLGASIFIG